ncbi:MAG: ferritin-like protein [Chthoniobacteraceae bacterium]|nr:ferritin-like protein [Chthoniobacteraceae bacterium]
MKIKTLRDLYLHELKDLYSAEKQLCKALPKMAKAASNEELVAAFEEHHGQTEQHVERIEQILDALGEPKRADKCEGMAGILAESEAITHEDISKQVLDAALIASAQKIEHYEIAGYGTVRTFAEILGEDEAAKLLQMTLDEEIETDEKLTELAEDFINAEAETAESE